VHAVRQVSFDVGRGETLGLVGESGSGKSTTGRAILRLVPVRSGKIELDGTDVLSLGKRELRGFRRHMQMVFQDPYSSLDPSMEIVDCIAEPLRAHTSLRGRQLRQRVVELLERVGLGQSHLHRYPNEFSGGQRQRIAIARAIAIEPSFLVCDEAVSALDVSTQNQVITLLEDLQRELGMSYLFIAHDLGVVRHIANRVAVMYLGRLVEWGPTERVFEQPAHPYTQALLSAVPVPDPAVQRARRRIILQGDLPDPASVPVGCPFSTRCPAVMPVCREVDPAPVDLPGGGAAACHLTVSVSDAVPS
jgi:peptide/nickel transport system ATP-binding protein